MNSNDSELKYGKIKLMKQSEMTSDCWLIQFDGLIACSTCEYANTDECGGGETLKKMKETLNESL